MKTEILSLTVHVLHMQIQTWREHKYESTFGLKGEQGRLYALHMQ